MADTSITLPEVVATAPAPAPSPSLPPPQAVTYGAGDQWLRRWSLVVSGPGGTILELSAGQNSIFGGAPATSPQGAPLPEGLRVKFHTFSLDAGIPNHAEIDVYNVAAATAARLTNGEFSSVVLQAGFANGRFGAIFVGTIKQVKRGRESAIDSYIRIYAADGDIVTQKALDPITMPRNSQAKERIQAIQQQMKQNGSVDAGTVDLGGYGGILPRQKIIWNMANENLDTTAGPLAQWSIQNGKLQVVPVKGYLPGEAVILNVHSGLVGVPEATQQGVFAVALINPGIRVRGLIKINNADVDTSEPAVSTTRVLSQGYPGYTDINFFASTAADGTYTVIYLEYEGDTRGNPWYVKICALLLDQSSQQIVTPAADGGFNQLRSGTGPTEIPPG